MYYTTNLDNSQKHSWASTIDHTAKLQALVSKMVFLDNKSISDLNFNILCSLRHALNIWSLASTTVTYSPCWLRLLSLACHTASPPETEFYRASLCLNAWELLLHKWKWWIRNKPTVYFYSKVFHGLGGFIQNLNGDCFRVIFPLGHLKNLYNIKNLHRRIRSSKCVIVT